MSNRIGAMVGYNTDVDILEKFRKNQELGINSCQICIWNVDIFKSDEHAEKIKAAIAETGINVSSLWAGWTGPCEWNFTAGPDTIGLVPVAYRFTRLGELKSASDFAEKIGVKQVVTHVGFIPEVAYSTEYRELVAILSACSYDLAMPVKSSHASSIPKDSTRSEYSA